MHTYVVCREAEIQRFSRLNIILVKENAPTPDSLGATNGLVLFAMCLTRSFCPAFVRYGDNQDNI